MFFIDISPLNLSPIPNMTLQPPELEAKVASLKASVETLETLQKYVGSLWYYILGRQQKAVNDGGI